MVTKNLAENKKEILIEIFETITSPPFLIMTMAVLIGVYGFIVIGGLI